METRTTLKHNIICERDFAHIDRKLKECPQISNVSLSRMVHLINNKTPQYLESLSEEERQKLIEKAVKEKAACVKKYQQMKQKIRQSRIEIMEERRKKIAKQAENKDLKFTDTVNAIYILSYNSISKQTNMMSCLFNCIIYLCHKQVRHHVYCTVSAILHSLENNSEYLA